MMTSVSFERSLEHCLQELACSDDIEASLRRYPQHADRLRPLLEMARVARRHYDAVPEPPGGLAGGRERLLAVAAQQRAQAASATPPQTAAWRGRRRRSLALAMRLVVALLVVALGTAAVGGSIAWAAGHSLPGDVLYPVKVALEDVRLALVSAPADQVDRSLQLVEKRVEEVQALVAAGQGVPDEAVARMERHVEHALTQAARVSDEEMVGLLARVAGRMHAAERSLAGLQPGAPPQAQANLARTVTICRKGAEAAEAGLADPQEFRWRYRHQQGTPDPTHAPGRATVTPGSDQEQDQEQYPGQDREGESTPAGAPIATPHSPRVTPMSESTPHAPQLTPRKPAMSPAPRGTPHTPQGPSATSVPQPTPQGPSQTAPPPAATEQSQPPDDTPGGDGSGGCEHCDGGHGDGEPGGGRH
jgi:hypothetical protein